MHRLGATLFIGLSLFVMAPASAAAAVNMPILNPDFAIVPEVCKACPCGFGGALQLIQNLVNAGVALAIVVVVIVIAWAGITFMLTPTNPENRTKARQMLTNAIIGLVILLSAWVVVDFVMKILYRAGEGKSGDFLPWNEIITGGDICIQTNADLRPLFTDPAGGSGSGGSGSGSGSAGSGTGAGSGSGAGGGGVSTGGTCSVQQSGGCAVSNLSAFGSAASQASQICNAESRGVIAAVSGSDRMRNDPQKRAFSFGLFQINITQHNVAGLKCPTAFKGKNYTALVINERLYAECVAAAKNPTHNIAEAVATYRRTEWREWSTGPKCGLAAAPSRGLAAVAAWFEGRLPLKQ